MKHAFDRINAMGMALYKNGSFLGLFYYTGIARRVVSLAMKF